MTGDIFYKSLRGLLLIVGTAAAVALATNEWLLENDGLMPSLIRRSLPGGVQTALHCVGRGKIGQGVVV